MTNPQNQQKQKSPPTCNKVAMFCTGGIRCEKVTAYCMKLVADRGIAVYHLEGGILAYLDSVAVVAAEQQSSSFVGECFVFDQRVAVTHGLRPTTTYTLCHACRHPVKRLLPRDGETATTTTVNCDDSDDSESYYQPGISCPHCYNDAAKREKRQRYVDRQRQIEIAARQGTQHMHDAKQVVASVPVVVAVADVACSTKTSMAPSPPTTTHENASTRMPGLKLTCN
jgi:UPF0176 protein